MPEKILISFKDTELEKKLLLYLKKKGQLIGNSAYIKQLIYEDMLRNEEAIKK